MARLKIGSGIRLEAQLPKVEQSEPKVEQSLDVMDLVEKALSLMPSPEVPQAEKIDLKPIMDRIEAIEKNNSLNISNVDHSLARLDQQVSAIFEKLDEKPVEVEKETIIEQPVVHQVTHVKDVSLEVLDQCKEMVRHAEVNGMIKIQDLQQRLNRQNKINIVLGSVLIITILLHLL